FDKPKELTPKEEQGYFDIWYPQGQTFHKLSSVCLVDRALRTGVFQLHQAAECFYNTVLLVFTGYKPKTHNLQKLRNYSKHISPDLYSIFRMPGSDEQEYHLFDLLKRG